MKKSLTLWLLLCLLFGNAVLSVAEPVLPKYVVPLNDHTNVRSETSQTGDNVVMQVGVEDILQVIGYSYDLEGNLWWRVIDYRSNKDGYTIAALSKEITEDQASEEKKRIDLKDSAHGATPTPTYKPAAAVIDTKNSSGSGSKSSSYSSKSSSSKSSSSYSSKSSSSKSSSSYSSKSSSDYDYDKGYGYTAPKRGESLSDYIKRQDPQLYKDMTERWNSLY